VSERPERAIEWLHFQLDGPDHSASELLDHITHLEAENTCLRMDKAAALETISEYKADSARLDGMDCWGQNAWEHFFYGGDNRSVRDRIDKVSEGGPQP